jgi:hypothetical protein
MKRFVVTALSLLVITPTLVAQGPAARTYETVTPEGAFTVEEVLPGDHASPASSNKNSSLGLFWDHPDGGLAWMGRSVSVGNRGTQVCSLHELNNERVQLFSAFDDDPPTPIWTDATIDGSDPLTVSSSSRGHYHVAMYWLNSKLNVHGYDSSSGTPLWTWTFSAGTANGGNVALDRDGTTVAIAVHESTAGEIHLYFLDPATGLEQFTPHYSQPFGGLRGFDFSADASTLYIHDGGSSVDIFDVASQSVAFSTTTNGSFDSHCISGDGTGFAFGGFGSVKIWEFDGISWSSSTISTGSGNYADEMDFSDDGLTLGFGVTQYSPAYNKVQAYILDVPSKTVVSHAIWTSSGTYQDVCSGASISKDGRYFAFGHWGDDLAANDEVYILERGSDIPVGSIDMRGSAFSVDIAADGQVTASCGKAVHANEYGNGGDVYCWDLGDEDLVIKGRPHIGQAIQIETYGTPGGTYIPHFSFGEFPDGLATQWGTLYIDPAPQHAPTLMYVATWPGAGTASDSVTIPPDSALVGLTIYLQYVSTPSLPGGWMLSQDYVALTFLP